MKKRFSITEQIGVNKAQSIFLNEFEWIFREQPVFDFGIDAHIEIVKDKNPTAKIAGLQIKTGDSHGQIYKAKESLTFYPKEEHIDYWTKSAIPVFLIAHLPENDITYWQNLSEKSLYLKTKKGWKVDIPYTNRLALLAKEELEDIIESHNDTFNLKKTDYSKEQGLTDNELSQLITEGFDEVKESLKLMITHNEIYNNKVNQHIVKGEEFTAKGLTFKDQIVKRQLKTLSVDINLLAKRFSPEIEVLNDRFSSIVSTVIIDLEKFMTLNPDRYISAEIIVGKPAKELQSSLEYARSGMKQLQESIANFPSLIPEIRKSKRNSTKVLQKLLESFSNTEMNLQKIINKTKKAV